MAKATVFAPTDAEPDIKEVLHAIRTGQMVTLDAPVQGEDTWQTRAAAALVSRVSHWTFSLGILLILATWLSINIVVRPVEPFPMLMLSMAGLALSVLANLQAPIILMVQRQQQKRDRHRAENDYRVNLKAELELRDLAQRVDLLLKQQQQLHQQLTRLRDQAPDEYRL